MPQNMEDMMMRRPGGPAASYNENEMKRADGVPAGSDPMAAIQRATGLNITMNDLVTAQNQETASRGMDVLTPDEAAQLNDNYVRIDPEKDAQREARERIEREVRASENETLTMLDNVLAEEEARDQRIAETLKDEQKREELYQGTPQEQAAQKTTYVPEMHDEGKPAAMKAARTARAPIDENNTPTADVDDLVPAYDYEEEEEEITAVENEADDVKKPDPEDREEYLNYLKGLRIVEHGEEETEDSFVRTVRDKAVMDPVDSGRYKPKIVGDQAFINAINKYKKDNFRIVSIPLVNSGFSVDIVGTGAVDLQLLYSAVDQNTLAVDYELEKMRTIIKNVVGVHPKIDRNELRNMIHFADYQLMAYAHIAATLKDIELIHTCDECGKDFHIVSKSSDLILNLDEMSEKMREIKNSNDVNDHSLMTKDIQLTTKSGFKVSLGHPSYSEYIQYMTELKRLLTEMDTPVGTRIQTLSEILPFIRLVILPNGVYTNNLFQRYMAMGMLTEDDYDDVLKAIEKMREQIIVPRFGIKKVVCPHCRKANSDIAYTDLNNLLFFHITVTRLLNQTDR